MPTKIKKKIPPRHLKGRSKRLNDLLRTVALSVSDHGKLEVLCTKAKISVTGLQSAIKRGYLTYPQGCAIEKAVGRKVVTVEQLCPEHFA